MSGPTAPRDLGNGLVLRWATLADRERIAEFNAFAFRDEPDQGPLPWDRAVIRELMGGRHPLVGAADFVYVEDTATGAVVSFRRRIAARPVRIGATTTRHVAALAPAWNTR